jgi:hypothetical protein
MSDLAWKKSSYSGATSGNCVEIAALPNGGRAIRDSKDPSGPVLVLTPAQWSELAQSTRSVRSALPHPPSRPTTKAAPDHRSRSGAAFFAAGGLPAPASPPATRATVGPIVTSTAAKVGPNLCCGSWQARHTFMIMRHLSVRSNAKPT